MAETQPGGLYKVGDRLVDSEGRPTKRVAVKEEESAFDVEGSTKEQLVAEAERRGITVTRADGKDGDPLVEDYRAALKG